MANATVLEQLSAGVDGMRQALQADHADVEVLGLEGTTARLRLIVGPETCQECILPKDALEQLLLMGIQEAMPGVTGVELEDPREE